MPLMKPTWPPCSGNSNQTFPGNSSARGGVCEYILPILTRKEQCFTRVVADDALVMGLGIWSTAHCEPVPDHADVLLSGLGKNKHFLVTLDALDGLELFPANRQRFCMGSVDPLKFWKRSKSYREVPGKS